jgi:hypothetical protein
MHGQSTIQLLLNGSGVNVGQIVRQPVGNSMQVGPRTTLETGFEQATMFLIACRFNLVRQPPVLAIKIAAPAMPSAAACSNSRGNLLPIISSLLFGCYRDYSVAPRLGNARFISGTENKYGTHYPFTAMALVSQSFLARFSTNSTGSG